MASSRRMLQGMIRPGDPITRRDGTRIKRVRYAGRCGYRPNEIMRCRAKTRILVEIAGEWKFRCHHHRYGAK